MKLFNREIFFDAIRGPLFGGAMTGGQVGGLDAVLDAWEANPRSDDLRWLSYPLATDYHETGKKMLPIEENGKGAGMAYGVEDPPGSGRVYYGRGYVQLTWLDNY